MKCLQRVGVGLVVFVGLMGPSVAMAQEELAQLNRPRFMQPIAGKRAPEDVDVARVPILRRRVSLDRQGLTVAEALRELTRQSGLRIAYNADILSLDRAVELRASSITVAAALTEILVGTGVDVLLKSPTQAVLLRRTAAVPQGAVLGRVTDKQTGQGLAATDVLLSGTAWKTVTDSAGRYRIAGVDTGSYTLMVRRLGYAKQSHQVRIREGGEDTVNVALVAAAIALNELVTTATGQQRRRDLGNAITTINADSVMRSAPIRSLTDLLENRVPGMTVQHTSGAPGDPSRLRLRGLSSALRSNDPILIVDGVRLYAAQADPRSGNLTNLGVQNITGGQNFGAGAPNNSPAPSPLDQIDPNIIEKIEVFKGPSAATLYGADAANGVIVVTTKKGRPGPTRWNASVIRGRTTTPGEWPEGYYRWGHVPRTGSVPTICPLVDFECVQDSVVRYQALNDPAATVLGKGQRTALSLTASGGNQTLTYSLTGSYSDEVGLLMLPAFEAERFRTLFNRQAPDWMQRPHRYETWSVTSSVGARLGSSADVTLSTSLSGNDQQRTSLENGVARLAGTYVDKLNGLYYVSSAPSPEEVTTASIVGAFKNSYLQNYYARTKARALAFTVGLNANWRPRSWFTASGQASLNAIPRSDEFFRPAGLFSPADSGGLILGSGRSLLSTFNLQGNLRKPIGGGFVFQTSIGTNLNTTHTQDLVSSASRLVPGTSSLNGAINITATEARVNTSVFGWYIEPRISGERISFSTGIRLDGGSAYGTRFTRTGGIGNILGLPKLNGSWVISEEPFFPFNGVFSSLRLRAAYGQSQVQPGVVDRLRLYQGKVEQTLRLDRVGNTELRPERAVEFEGGFDADLLDSRISVQLTAYRKMQVDALMTVQLPTSVNGGGSVIKNIGNIRNTGLELEVGLTPVRLPMLSWSAQLQYSRNSNTLVKLGRGVAPDKAQGLVEGYPLRGRWAKPILGYGDENNNGVLERWEIQIGDSLAFVGRLLPAYTTRLFTNVALFGGAVGITAGFNYESGAVQMNQTARKNWVLAPGLTDPAAPSSEQAAWIASVFRGSNPADVTDYGLMQDVSTFRFNSLSVNYRAPDRIARLLRAQQLQVAVQGSNLGLHSTYQGIDPNVNTWSPDESIRDTGQLPMPRTWQFTVNLTY